MLAGVGLSLVIFLVGWRGELLGLEARQSAATHARAVAIRFRVEEIQNLLATFAALMSVRPDVDETGFREFGQRLEWRRAGVENIGWVPRVPRDQRSEFEQRHSGLRPFRILGFEGEGRLGPAGEAEAYFPLTLVLSSIEGQRIPYGFDLASEPLRRQAIEATLRSARYTVSPLIAVNNQVAASDGLRIIALFPVGGAVGAAAAGDSPPIDGFVAAVVDIGTLMDAALAERPEPRQDLVLTEEQGNRLPPRVLHVYAPGKTDGASPDGPFELDGAMSEPVPVGGREWMLYSAPAEPLAAAAASHAARLPLVVLAFFGVIVAFVHRLQHMRIASKEARDLELGRLRLTDELTGLPNRAQLLELLTKASGQPRALLLLNVRRFRRVVESVGDRASDRVLRALADRLCAVVDPQVTVARLGGDEFALLRTGPGASLSSVQELAARLRRTLQKAIVVGPHTFHLQCAMAAVHAVEGAMGDGETVVARVTAAMRRSKTLLDHDEVAYDDDRSGRDDVRRMSMETALRRAFESQEVQVFFQPQVHAQTLALHGFESLVRWQHDGRWIPPSEFLDVAAEADLMVPLGDMIMERSLAQAAAWRRQHPDFRGRVAVNISAEQFARARFVDELLQKLARHGVAGEWLELEITEGVLVEDLGRTRRALHELANAGIHTALDDFGTGYSSLSYLKDLPVQWIKIDRSFVSGIHRDRGNAAIVRGTLAIARELRLGVIAEGVETAEQFGQIQAMGCDAVQGYLFSPAVQAQDTWAFFEGFRKRVETGEVSA